MEFSHLNGCNRQMAAAGNRIRAQKSWKSCFLHGNMKSKPSSRPKFSGNCSHIRKAAAIACCFLVFQHLKEILKPTKIKIALNENKLETSNLTVNRNSNVFYIKTFKNETELIQNNRRNFTENYHRFR